MRALLAAVLLCAAPAAAEVTLTADASRTSLTVGDQLQLSVTVSGDKASLPEPRIPPLSDFSVYSAGKSQSLSFVNGRMSSSVTFTYVLSPRAAGKFRIPPITADGASAPTAPIEVEVAPAGAAGMGPSGPMPGTGVAPAPAPAPPAAARRRGADVFVTAALDKARATVDEQVTLTVRFYSAVQLIGDLSYDPPATNGFLAEDLPPVRSGMTQIDGRPYQFQEIKVALFPIQAGTLTVGAAGIHCQVARMGGPGGDDFFDRFFAMAAPQPVNVRSQPLTVRVDPPPPGKPADFSGFVGRLSAKASADRTSVKAGDAVTLTVTVSGRGNLKTLPEPRKPDLPSLRFFETESSVALDRKDDVVGGTKTFRTVVVPRVSGDVTVPAFSFPYYDPAAKRYAGTATAPIVLHVAPGDATEAPSAAPAAPAAPGLTAIADDIRYLKTSPSRSAASAALAAVADLGPWNAAPFVVFTGAALAAWRRRAAAADPRGRRFREALARAEERLARAAALPASDSARAAALVDEALAAYVADKLDAPAAGLTLKAALEGLKSLPKPPSAETLRRLGEAWEEADLRRFAPGAAGADAARFVEETRALLRSLDAEARR